MSLGIKISSNQSNPTVLYNRQHTPPTGTPFPNRSLIYEAQSDVVLDFFSLLALHHYEDELVIGGDEDLMFVGFKAHEGELVVGVEVENGGASLGDQLGYQSG